MLKAPGPYPKAGCLSGAGACGLTPIEQISHTLCLLLLQVGLGLVAAAALASGYSGSASLAPAGSSSSRGTMAAGIVMILASQLVAAGQLLIDQSSWNTWLQLSPLKIVGCEGLLGMLLTVSESMSEGDKKSEKKRV